MQQEEWGYASGLCNRMNGVMDQGYLGGMGLCIRVI